tara:strand:- start:1524 stop:1940 length:417 start_codon:yes stop_codon:yes gene_type:complete
MSNYKTDALGNNAPIEKSLVQTIIANTTLSNTDSGTNYLVGTDALVLSLSAAKDGVRLRVFNSGADGNNIVTISPIAGESIIGTISNAAADSVSGGVAGKDIINTKATANKGDYIDLLGVTSIGWYIDGGVGIWASEA